MTDAPVRPLLPAPDEFTQFFWDAARQHKLMFRRCTTCGTFQHPPEPVCQRCLSFDFAPAEVSGRGEVYSYAMATQAFHPYFADKLPLCIAVVELAEQAGLRMVSNIVDLPPDGVSVGDPVELDFRALDDDFVLPVFRLAKP
jgi:uncharacterized OB-fold protein